MMILHLRSESKSISRLCPKCLVPQKRLAEHVAVCCSTMTAKEILDAIAGEHDRGKALCVVEYQLEALKEEFPATQSACLYRAVNGICWASRHPGPTTARQGAEIEKVSTRNTFNTLKVELYTLLY